MKDERLPTLDEWAALNMPKHGPDVVVDELGFTPEDYAEMARARGNRPHLISEAELRAAGALDVPPEWRKSLSAGRRPVERNLFSGLSDDDDTRPENDELTADDADDAATEAE